MYVIVVCYFFFFFKQKTAYEMRISDLSSDVCSSDLQSAIDSSPTNMTAVLSSMTVRSTALIRGVTIAVRATRSPRGVRAMIETERGAVLYDAIYTPEVVMARVGHLRPDEQRTVELVERIIRSRFDPGDLKSKRLHS